MEILLITDTYLSSVPFGGEVIKTNNDSPSSGGGRRVVVGGQDQRKWRSQEKVPYILNWAWPWATGPH